MIYLDSAICSKYLANWNKISTKIADEQTKNGLEWVKVGALNLLKINAVKNIDRLAIIPYRGKRTIHRWLQVFLIKPDRPLHENLDENNFQPLRCLN